MRATLLAITGRSFRRAPLLWSMGQDGITRRISVPQCGMDGHTPTVWELDSPTQPIPVGASATDTATIPGTTRGGDRWGTTDMAGIPITAGERGAEQRSPTCTVYGATPHILVPERLGQILTPETTEQPRADPTTTPRPAGPQWQDEAPTRISTPGTPPDIAAARPTIRTPGSSRAAEPGTPETSTAARAQPDAVDSPTTRTRELA